MVRLLGIFVRYHTESRNYVRNIVIKLLAIADQMRADRMCALIDQAGARCQSVVVLELHVCWQVSRHCGRQMGRHVVVSIVGSIEVSRLVCVWDAIGCQQTQCARRYAIVSTMCGFLAQSYFRGNQIVARTSIGGVGTTVPLRVARAFARV